MDENIGAFVVFFYVIIWIFTALNYETEEENKLIVWAITLAWPFILIMRLIKQ